uniref:Uncharacterized protein n=1 Tax=Avena sativa TaxID=4498 RepID=A0ACD5ZZW6_AVESA
MPREIVYSNTIEEAVRLIIPYLEDTGNNARKAIYFEGWEGLGASAVLRAVAKDPPSSLLKILNKIIHVDCSRWKSRRELQRKIARELKLPRQVMDVIDRQDEEDDFRGVDESSRAEIDFVGRQIFQALMGHRCLVVFHNGSNDMVNLSAFGIPQVEFFDTKVLWTFQGRLRLNSKVGMKVDNSHIHLYAQYWPTWWNVLLKMEAREIAGYINMLAEEVEQCCMYLLSLNYRGGNKIDYNWATHASNYWVCDGIIKGGQVDKAWEVAVALHQLIHIEDYSSNSLPSFGSELETPSRRWIFARDNSALHPDATSFFLAAVPSMSNPPLIPLPDGMFHQSDKLCVLKLFRCSFSFSSPPFRCCRRVRFLGFDDCKDQPEEHAVQDRPAMLFCESLWVLDISNTNYDLSSSPEIIDQMAKNIREVHINKGRIWSTSGFSWRKLQNLRKLRVIAPTCTWETGQRDEFTDMVNMEFLDLSCNSTIEVLPSLLGAISLTTMILDGCVGLEHVGPDGLPPLLESFSLDAQTSKGQNREAKISRISLAGCARLVKFRLGGFIPNLEELDLSGTLVKTLDLKDQVVQAASLQRVTLLGCLQLHAILWPENGLPKLMVLHIDSLACRVHSELGEAYGTILDMRFFQTLVLESNLEFCWGSTRFHLNLGIPCTKKVGEKQSRQSDKEMIDHGSSEQVTGCPRPKLLIPNNCSTYNDVYIETVTTDQDYNSSPQLQPSGCHVDIGDGIYNTRVECVEGIKAIMFVMNTAMSLHVHDNSSITTVIPENMIYIGEDRFTWKDLEQCYVVRCPKMHTVFTTNYDQMCFPNLVTFCAANLLKVHCIWSKGRMNLLENPNSFAELRSIHLYSCPRLTYVLPLSWAAPDSYLPNLETLHIINCGDLKEVFPVKPLLSTKVSSRRRKGGLWFPNLRHIYLHELYKLQHICEDKMFAPELETIRLRGCWGFRRLPSVGPSRDNRRRPVVECEKDWWEKLEWDGMEAGHHPFLFEPRHSSYYKKPLPRVSVLR